MCQKAHTYTNNSVLINVYLISGNDDGDWGGGGGDVNRSISSGNGGGTGGNSGLGNSRKLTL